MCVCLCASYSCSLTAWCLHALFPVCVSCVHVEILRNYESMLEVILPSLPATADGMSSPEGRAAFVWILGEYGDVSKRKGWGM